MPGSWEVGDPASYRSASGAVGIPGSREAADPAWHRSTCAAKGIPGSWQAGGPLSYMSTWGAMGMPGSWEAGDPTGHRSTWGAMGIPFSWEALEWAFHWSYDCSVKFVLAESQRRLIANRCTWSWADFADCFERLMCGTCICWLCCSWDSV
jgi:hypothetical protein